MLIYISVLVLLFILDVLKLEKKKFILFLINFFLVFFLCFTYTNGSDWRQYEFIYSNVNGINEYNPYLHLEYGFFLLQYLFKNIFNFDFWFFFISFKVLFFLIIIKKIKPFVSNYYFLSLAIFISFFGLYLLIDAPFRNMIAIGFFLLSLDSLYSNKIYKYYFYIILGSFFHLSLILFLVLPNLVKRKYSMKVLTITFLFINILFGFGIDLFFKFSDSFKGIIPFLDTKIENNFSNSDSFVVRSIFSLGYFIRLFILLLVFKFRDKILTIYGNITFNMIILFFYTYVMALSLDIFFRINLYFFIYFIFSIIILLRLIQKNLKLGFYSYILLVSLLSTILTITSSYKYIPYTNYLEYLDKEKPSFYERNIYNINKSPYNQPTNSK